MKKIKQSPKLPAEQRRTQLLKSAEKLFVKKGYRVTTTEEIARNASLTKGALYYHFKSKEDILYHLVRSMSESFDATFEASVAKGMKPSDFFRMLTRVHECRDLRDPWDIIDIWVQAMRIPRIKRYVSARIERFVELFAAHVDPGFAMNKTAMRQLGMFTLGLYDGLSIARFLAPSLVDLDSQAKLFESFFEEVKSRRTRRIRK